MANGGSTSTPSKSADVASLPPVPFSPARKHKKTHRYRFARLRSPRAAKGPKINLCIAATAAVLALTGCGAAISPTPATPTQAVSDPQPSTRGAGHATIKRVIDGDTVMVHIQGKDERVRLIGVDTPETVDPHRPIGCFGPQASAFTKSLLPAGTPVDLERDAELRDKYQRLLAYIYRSSDHLFINAELARQGYANLLTIPPNVAHSADFVALVADARENRRGLWSACSP